MLTINDDLNFDEAQGCRDWIPRLKDYVSVAICVADVSARDGQIGEVSESWTKIATTQSVLQPHRSWIPRRFIVQTDRQSVVTRSWPSAKQNHIIAYENPIITALCNAISRPTT